MKKTWATVAMAILLCGGLAAILSYASGGGGMDVPAGTIMVSFGINDEAQASGAYGKFAGTDAPYIAPGPGAIVCVAGAVQGNSSGLTVRINGEDAVYQEIGQSPFSHPITPGNVTFQAGDTITVWFDSGLSNGAVSVYVALNSLDEITAP